MEQQLRASIDAAIQQHMSGAVGEELRKVLNDYDTCKRDLAFSKEQHAKSEAALKAAQAQLREQIALDEQVADLGKREAKLLTDRAELITKWANVEAQVANARANTALDMFALVFKPAMVRETIAASIPVGVNGGGNMCGTVFPNQASAQTTTRSEE